MQISQLPNLLIIPLLLAGTVLVFVIAGDAYLKRRYDKVVSILVFGTLTNILLLLLFWEQLRVFFVDHGERMGSSGDPGKEIHIHLDPLPDLTRSVSRYWELKFSALTDPQLTATIKILARINRLPFVRLSSALSKRKPSYLVRLMRDLESYPNPRLIRTIAQHIDDYELGERKVRELLSILDRACSQQNRPRITRRICRLDNFTRISLAHATVTLSRRHDTKQIIREGVDIPVLNAKLIDAALSGDVATVRDLLASGARANSVAAPYSTSPELTKALSAQTTPLIAAIRGGKREIAELLLAVGASPQLGCWSGLIEAVRTGDKDTVQDLLQLGADPILRSLSGESALSLAAASNSYDIAELLDRSSATG